jgi:hypothetical protein
MIADELANPTAAIAAAEEDTRKRAVGLGCILMPLPAHRSGARIAMQLFMNVAALHSRQEPNRDSRIIHLVKLSAEHSLNLRDRGISSLAHGYYLRSTTSVMR